jgi:WD40 repeat protein
MAEIIREQRADKVIKIWDFRTGDQKRTIQGFKGNDRDSGLSLGDGSERFPTIISSSGDKSVYTRNSDKAAAGPRISGGTDFMYASSMFLGRDQKSWRRGQDSVLRVWNSELNANPHSRPPATEITASADSANYDGVDLRPTQP